MKTFLICLGVAATLLTLTGFLSLGSFQGAGISVGLILAMAGGLWMALTRQNAKMQRQAKASGKSIVSHEHAGVRVFHPDGSKQFHRYPR